MHELALFEMYFIVICLICHWSQGLPVETTIQIQNIRISGEQKTSEQVLVNGVLLTNRSNEVVNIIQTISSAPLEPLGKIALEEKMNSRNHTVIRVRECILSGSGVHTTDRICYDGMVHLTLDPSTDTWIAQTPQALALQGLLDQDLEHNRQERIQLQEGCINLTKEMKISDDKLGYVIGVLAIVLGLLTLIGYILLDPLISKIQGWRHSGAVIGSIVHYPRHGQRF